jgi:hypothetical protein
LRIPQAISMRAVTRRCGADPRAQRFERTASLRNIEQSGPNARARRAYITTSPSAAVVAGRQAGDVTAVTVFDVVDTQRKGQEVMHGKAARRIA